MKCDTELMTVILEKEDSFSKEISGLAEQISSDRLAGNLKDYLNGLNDLKNDFLCVEEEDNDDAPESTLWADRYWYFERT